MNRKRIQTRNGVRVVVHVQNGGSTVEADCGCYGTSFRVHTRESCPNRLAQQAVSNV